MPLPVTPGAGATIGGRNDGQGEFQAILMAPFSRLPVGATFHFVASVLGTLAPPATAQMALIAPDPGAAFRWSTAATANGTLGLPIMAAGSYPEALEVVGSTMLSKFNYALLAGEVATGRFNVEYYRFIV
jgi:hypothetical protein